MGQDFEAVAEIAAAALAAAQAGPLKELRLRSLMIVPLVAQLRALPLFADLPDDVLPRIYAENARRLFGVVDWDGAVQVAVTSDARLSASVLAVSGNVQSKLGLYADARANLQASLAIDSQQPEVWSCLGFVLEKLGDNPAARQAYQAALAVQPDYPPAIEGLQRLP